VTSIGFRRSGRYRTVGTIDISVLEPRVPLAAASTEFVGLHPTAGDHFGMNVASLSTGNVVITASGGDSAGLDANAGREFRRRGVVRALRET
jgi:hypothetical protein